MEIITSEMKEAKKLACYNAIALLESSIGCCSSEELGNIDEHKYRKACLIVMKRIETIAKRYK